MVRSDFKVHWKYIHTFESRDIKQHAATHDRRYLIHTELRHPVLVGVFHVLAAVEYTVAGIMTQRIDMCADVSSQGDGIGRRGRSTAVQNIAMLLGQTVQKRGMRGEMRHAGEIGLP